MQKFWSVLFGAVILIEIIAVLITPSMGWGLPKNVSSYGPEVDYLFHLILAITGVAFLLTEGIMVYYMWRYAGEPGRKATYVHGNHRLEMVWTLVPAGILLFIALAQVSAWGRIKYQSRMPAPQQVFEVSARQFEWRMRYPSVERMESMGSDSKVMLSFPQERHFDDVHVVNEVHIWKDAEVRIFLKTRDVLHSFFLPNLRVKQDALPGKTIPVYVKAVESNCRWNSETNQLEQDPDNHWELACAELCGWGHYKMQGKVYVHPDVNDFKQWLRHQQAKQRSRTGD